MDLGTSKACIRRSRMLVSTDSGPRHVAAARGLHVVTLFGPMLPGKSGIAAVRRLAGLQEELGQLNDLASAGTLLMVCAGRDPHLREAVTLIGGWHGQRHAALLGDIPDKLKLIRGLKLPRLDDAAS